MVVDVRKGLEMRHLRETGVRTGVSATCPFSAPSQTLSPGLSFPIY